MHGRKRSEYKALQRDEKVAASLAKKAQQWHALSAELQTRRQQMHESSKNNNDSDSTDDATSGASDEVSLDLLDKLLTVNPDPLYLWNHRREILLLQARSTSSAVASSTNNNNTSNLTLEQVQRERQITLTALQNNPKAYGPWFHRKWVLSEFCRRNSSSSGSGSGSGSSTSSSHGDAAAALDILKQELALTAEFLQRDERNFHGWSFRRFIVALLLEQQDGISSDGLKDDAGDSKLQFLGGDAWNGSWRFRGGTADAESAPSEAAAIATTTLMGAQVAYHKDETTTTSIANQAVALQWLQHEWDFSLTKIRDNFSNFSAFHYRSKLLPLKLRVESASQQDDGVELEFLKTELELVQNAVFTEPDDQTAWWYQRFLLQQFSPSSSSSAREDDKPFLSTWQEHVEALQELRTEVATCKWVLLGILTCLERFPSSSSTTAKQQEDLLQELQELDPDRRVRYQHLLRKLQKQRNKDGD